MHVHFLAVYSVHENSLWMSRHVTAEKQHIWKSGSVFFSFSIDVSMIKAMPSDLKKVIYFDINLVLVYPLFIRSTC